MGAGPHAQRSKRVTALHEKAGPGQVDFDLPFLKSSLFFLVEGSQSGPERSRARSLRRQRTLDGEDRSVTIPPGRKGSDCLDFWLRPISILNCEVTARNSGVQAPSEDS